MMNHRPGPTLVIAIALPCFFWSLPTPSSARVQQDRAVPIAERILARGAELFSNRNAEGLAQTYQIDATLEILTREPESREITAQQYVGRTEIAEYYRSIFGGDGRIDAVNRVEFARLIQPDLLLITGTLIIETNQNLVRIPFVQTRIRVDSDWQIRKLTIYLFSSE